MRSVAEAPNDIAKLRAIAEAATPGEWQWYGNTKMREVYLATVDRGRVFVMQFERWGMAGAQPRFQVRLSVDEGGGIMRNLDELGDLGPKMVASHRNGFVGIAHPDATHIATFSPPTVLSLLDEIEALRRDVERLGGLLETHKDLEVKRVTLIDSLSGKRVTLEGECVKLAIELRCAQIQAEDRGRSYQQAIAERDAAIRERDEWKSTAGRVATERRGDEVRAIHEHNAVLSNWKRRARGAELALDAALSRAEKAEGDLAQAKRTIEFLRYYEIHDDGIAILTRDLRARTEGTPFEAIASDAAINIEQLTRERDEWKSLAKERTTPATAGKEPRSLLDWGPDGLYDDTRATHLHGLCHASSDGECSWRECPQVKKYESHCPLDKGRRE